MTAAPAPTRDAAETLSRGRALGRAYFAAQAAAGALWWCGVFAVPGVREATLGPLPPVTVAALDLPLFVLASALAAAGMRAPAWIAAGWTVLVAIGMALLATLTGAAGWGALLMIAAAVGSVAAALLARTGRLPAEWISIGPFAFRPAAPAAPGRNLRRTGRQIVLFWGLFLGVIPLLIAAVELRWGLRLPPTPWPPLAGAVLLPAASALGLWSGATMSARGRGTPLPSAMPTRLVVSGPYRVVRNPMAAAGIAQAAAVGLLFGSWLVVLYALCGAVFWHVIIRPVEEADLAARFGADYAEYRSRVRCWWPRRGAAGSGSSPRPRDDAFPG